MMLLLTGQPGHGKTAYGLVRARKFKEEGREVYAHGIKDLDYERIGFHRLDEPKDWESLPDGSVVLLDECYTTFPNRNPASKVPEHVEALARHRHRGFDFILIAQQGLQLDPFLRGLYDEHIHVRKQWGTRKTNLRRWDSYQGNVKGACSDVETWIRPSEIFTFYTSTTLDTNKRRLPMWVRYLLIALALLMLVLLVVKHRYSAKIAEATATQEAAKLARDRASGVTGGGTTTGAAVARAFDTPAAYATAHLPRFPSMPWTAPIYDERMPVAQPELFCASSLAGLDAQGEWSDASCTCVTEQATKYDIPDGVCRRLASQGPVYNPYKEPVREAAPAARVASSDAFAPVVGFGIGEATFRAQQARYGQMRDASIPADYEGSQIH